MNPWFRKAAAGRPLGIGASKPHYVTPAGSSTKKQKHTPFLEMVDMDSGIRYALKSINQAAAKLFRRTFEQKGLKNLDYSVELCSVGERPFRALVVHSEKKGDVPVFEIGKVFGVTNKFVNILTEKLAAATTQRAATALVSAAAISLGVSFREILGEDPSPFPEFKESQYGSRFHMCTDTIKQAYSTKLEALKQKG